jgi:hypothetical protein
LDVTARRFDLVKGGGTGSKNTRKILQLPYPPTVSTGLLLPERGSIFGSASPSISPTLQAGVRIDGIRASASRLLGPERPNRVQHKLRPSYRMSVATLQRYRDWRRTFPEISSPQLPSFDPTSRKREFGLASFRFSPLPTT